jgi:(+)-trans-carveol dehydrogenase
VKLEGQVALITGAARGQGASHARYLAREGARIAALDICRDIELIYPLGTKEELDGTVAAVQNIGSEAIAIEADVRSSEQMAAAVSAVVDRWGRIDILCNNAGVCVVGEAIDEVTDLSLNTVIDICLKGVMQTTRFVAPVMKQQNSGKIINTSSCGALKAMPYISSYTAAKGAIIQLTQSWANELAEWGITVNAIAPGSVLTGMVTGLAGQLGRDANDAWEEFGSYRLFSGERGHLTVDDLSRMVVFLASNEAQMITGQVIAVDAGWSVSAGKPQQNVGDTRSN